MDDEKLAKEQMAKDDMEIEAARKSANDSMRLMTEAKARLDRIQNLSRAQKRIKDKLKELEKGWQYLLITQMNEVFNIRRMITVTESYSSKLQWGAQ